MVMNLFINDHAFLISRSFDVQENVTAASDGAYLFGYVFTSSAIIKNRVLTDEEFNFIEENHGGLSGVFCVISKFGDSIKLFLDPLAQYPIFYSVDDFQLSISNDVWLLSVSLQKFAFEERYIFDSLAYQSPLRGLTIAKDVFAVQYDDLYCKDTDSYKKPFQLSCYNFQFVVPSIEAYNDLDYESLLSIYIEKLNVRAKILANTYDEVHLQLTGGRIVDWF